jgi:ferric iron reductase protein FhuF
MTATDPSLSAVTDLVAHLRWRIGEPGPDDLVSIRLADDPDHLAAVVASTAAGRGSEDPQVLGSLWWQAYAYRVGGTTLAACVLEGSAPDPAAEGTGVSVARSRPAGLIVDPGAPSITDLGTILQRLFAGNLEPVADALRARHSLGERLIWGNAAAGIASALGAVASAEGAPDLREPIETVVAALPHGMPDLGEWLPGGWDYRRTTCCLWWKTTVSGGGLCTDCPLPAPPPSADVPADPPHPIEVVSDSAPIGAESQTTTGVGDEAAP